MQEVQYDILGSRWKEPDKRIFFKHIKESELMNIKKNSDM